MRRPIVFADLQGTICFNGWNFDKDLFETIKFLKKNNGLFVINTTATPTKTISRLAKELDADIIISKGGELIEEVKTKKIYQDYISNYQLRELLRFLKQESLTLKLQREGKQELLVVNQRELENKVLLLHGVEVIEIEKPKEVIEQDLKQLRESGLFVYTDTKHVLTIRTMNDKGSALRWVCEDLFKLEVVDAMAIGDGSADIPALKMAGFSYAMADSDRRLMDITRFYTSRAEQGGVSEAIYDYLYRLIKVKPERWI